MYRFRLGVMVVGVVFVVAALWNGGNAAQGQTGSSKTPAANGPTKPETVTKEDAAAIEKQKAVYPLDTCVVQGEKLGEHGEVVDFLYKGRLVRFCCAGCITAFEKEPAKYLARLDAAEKSKAKEGTRASQKAPAEVWTCTMHPEVRLDKPGKCSKCGMDLVKANTETESTTSAKK